IGAIEKRRDDRRRQQQGDQQSEEYLGETLQPKAHCAHHSVTSVFVAMRVAILICLGLVTACVSPSAQIGAGRLPLPAEARVSFDRNGDTATTARGTADRSTG